jgi:hypothetical protein
MQNDPTGTSGSGRCSTYFDAIRRAEEDVSEALGHVRAEEDAGRITTVEAAAERVGLLERHLERCRQLRAEHLGGTP